LHGSVQRGAARAEDSDLQGRAAPSLPPEVHLLVDWVIPLRIDPLLERIVQPVAQRVLRQLFAEVPGVLDQMEHLLQDRAARSPLSAAGCRAGVGRAARDDHLEGFVLLPRQWVVERTFAWLGRRRRLAKDWEKSIESSTAWAHIASIRMIARRIARYCYAR
jgi:transposase